MDLKLKKFAPGDCLFGAVDWKLAFTAYSQGYIFLGISYPLCMETENCFKCYINFLSFDLTLVSWFTKWKMYKSLIFIRKLGTYFFMETFGGLFFWRRLEIHLVETRNSSYEFRWWTKYSNSELWWRLEIQQAGQIFTPVVVAYVICAVRFVLYFP